MNPILFAAAGEFAYTPPGPPTAADPFGLLVRLVVLTSILLGLCAAVWWAARRANRPKLPADAAASKRIRLEGRLALDRRCTLFSLRVDGHPIAVSTDASGLRSIVLLSETFSEHLPADAI